MTAKRGRRIVIADDEPATADTLAMILTESGLRVLRGLWRDFRAGEYFKLRAPDLLITDVVMPDRNGIEVAMEARRLAPGCCALLFSGSARSPDLIRAADSESAKIPLLSKPVAVNELLETITTLLNAEE